RSWSQRSRSSRSFRFRWCSRVGSLGLELMEPCPQPPRTAAPRAWSRPCRGTLTRLRGAGMAGWAAIGGSIEQSDLGAIVAGHDVTVPAAGLVGLGPADLDRGPLGGRWVAIDQALVACCELSAYDADGVELVHLLGDREECPHGAKRLSPEVHIRARDNHPNTMIGEVRDHTDNARIEELHLVDSDDLRIRAHTFGDLGRR